MKTNNYINEKEQEFLIGKDNFGVEKIIYKIDKKKLIIKDLIIYGSEKLFELLSDDEKSRWSWALYPPKLYFKDLLVELDGSSNIQQTITKEILDKHEVGLYLMEHNDIFGKFTIDKSNMFKFKGTVYISGKKKNLELEVKLKA